jgi:competence protein ComEC
MKLRYGYVIMGIVTGLILFLQWIPALPDGSVHVTFCDVGQGDATLVRFPDGRRMLVDTGSGSTGLICLGKYLPFFEKTIDIVVISHPQADHAAGLPALLSRYHVTHIIHADALPNGELGNKISAALIAKNTTEHTMYAGDSMTVGGVTIRSLSPEPPSDGEFLSWKRISTASDDTVLGTTTGDMNTDCLVLQLTYGTFDIVLTGDADAKSQPTLQSIHTTDSRVELLKVPHHGSKTGLSESFLSSLCVKCNRTDRHPIAVISVGKNTYGHPSTDTIKQLEGNGFDVYRTDKHGDISVASDGLSWEIYTEK